MTIDCNTLLSSGVGALMGSALTLLAAYLTHRWDISKQKEQDAQLLKGILQAMHDEIETLWDAYIEGIGNQIEALQDGHPLNMYWPITQDYFTVYNSNAFFIGRIQDHDLRKLIVSTYSNARGLIDSYRLNYDFVNKYEHAFWLYQETNNQMHKANADACYTGLVQYSSKLKKRHTDVKQQVQALLRALRKEGVFAKS